MKMGMLGRVVACSLALGSLAGCAADVDEPAPEGRDESLTLRCIQNVLCRIGDHWDPVRCRCVPNPQDAGAPVDAGSWCTSDAQCPSGSTCVLPPNFVCPPNALCLPVGQCEPSDAGGACVSQIGEHCGGFIANPCTCAPGLECVLGSIPDVGGTCQAPDAGAPPRCCPRTWNMYKCQEADGTSGLNCHNPALGCASSLQCGGGCDFEVSGVCPVCDPLVCPAGQTWDSSLCRCVATGCVTAKDCTGPLPALCEICDGGAAGCAHHVCVDGTCQIAFCQ